MSSKKSFRRKYVEDFDDEGTHENRKRPNEVRRPIKNWTKAVEKKMNELDDLEDIFETG
jgi:hypothetical protein